jgi:predicted dehydrogenase
MPNKVRWGVLGAANIALKKVIPGMQAGQWCDIAAIASRDPGRARAAAAEAGIPKAYGSYEELLADPAIDAIYNPLPNHLHVPWSVKAAEAGKHVLCEKPIALNAAEVRLLLEARQRTGVKIGEAFMVRTHPQWLRAREIVRAGGIGELRSVVGAFSYFNRDAHNIRNIAEWGGGALMDIGCYPIVTSRFVYGTEPRRVAGLIERDPDLRVDRLTSALLEFPNGHAVFTCGTQMLHYQRMQIVGTKGRIELEIPFNAPPDRPTRILVDTAGDLFGLGIRVEEFPVCDQYGIQGDLFSRAILEGGEVPTPLEESLANMAVIDAVFRSAASGRWEEPTV